MSTLASTGELTPAELAQRVLTLSYFHRVSADDYRVLLRHLIKIDHIQVTEGGGLIVGLRASASLTTLSFTPCSRKRGVHRSQRVGRVGHDRQSATAR